MNVIPLTVTDNVAGVMMYEYIRILTSIPEGFHVQVEEAVKDFVSSSRLGEGIDREGLIQQTYEGIVSFVRMGAGDFWVATKNGELIAYALARMTKDVDNRMTYWVSQGWIKGPHRGKSLAKKAWKKLRQRAKDLLCSHIVVVAGRNERAYKRFLGMHHYATLLKEDLWP